MILREQLLSLGFYELTHFTGSDGNMRYWIDKQTPEAEEGREAEAPYYRAIIWPGPLSFENTPEDKKESHRATADEAGMQALVGWLNEKSAEYNPD